MNSCSIASSKFWYACLGRSGRYTSIFALSDRGNEALLSLSKILHALEGLLWGELGSLWSFDLQLGDLWAIGYFPLTASARFLVMRNRLGGLLDSPRTEPALHAA